MTGRGERFTLGAWQPRRARGSRSRSSSSRRATTPCRWRRSGYPITPVGLHYLLIHFDIPHVDPATWRLEVGGLVARPAHPVARRAEGAAGADARGDAGVRRQRPRALRAARRSASRGCSRRSAPPSGRARRSRRSSRRRGSTPSALEVVFTGLDRGVQGEVEHAYERSLPLAEALRDEVLLAYAINGQPLPPQHGFPLRLLVPSWYGMTHVKWLRSITVVDEPFRGWQQEVAYHLRQSEDEPGTPVTRILPRALMVPPGIPTSSRARASSTPGRACSKAARGRARRRSARRGEHATAARAGPTRARASRSPSSRGSGWSYEWDAEPGRARALLPRDGRERADAAGRARVEPTTASATTSSSASASSC